MSALVVIEASRVADGQARWWHTSLEQAEAHVKTIGVDDLSLVEPSAHVTHAVVEGGLVRIRLDFTVAVAGSALPRPDILDLIEHGLKAAVPSAVEIQRGASIKITRAA